MNVRFSDYTSVWHPFISNQTCWELIHQNLVKGETEDKSLTSQERIGLLVKESAIAFGLTRL